MARLLETTFIQGPAGRLEALHETPDEDKRIERAAVICHPHPLYGGTLHNKVVFRLARAARRSGAAVLRFNFRGVGASSGFFDDGMGEQDDLCAALAYMSERYPGLPLIAGGFSFGSRVGLRVVCQDARIERFVAAGTPVKHGNWSFLEDCACPKFFIHSTEDVHGDRATMEAVFAAVAAPKQIAWIQAEDHFFRGAVDEFEEQAYQAWSAGISGR